MASLATLWVCSWRVMAERLVGTVVVYLLIQTYVGWTQCTGEIFAVDQRAFLAVRLLTRRRENRCDR